MRDSAFTVGLRLSGRLCVVVGSSSETLARTQSLLEAGARVLLLTRIEPERTASFDANPQVTIARRPFVESDLDAAWFAVLTDQDESTAAAMFRAAEQRRVFFCAIDQPAYSSYSHLARAHAGSVCVAVSTNGRAPALARQLRRELTRLFDAAGLAAFVEALGDLRERLPRARRRRTLARIVGEVRLIGRLELPELPELPGSSPSSEK